jgi:putative DNA primase/helicase
MSETLINATYDLKTGIGRKPDPLDYITKKTACRVAPPGTPHPLWSAFLDRVTDHDAELQAFLQRWCGYCCTGITTEHVFVFCYGTGANGKSTFVNTIRGILGDYAVIADMATFLDSKSERHPTDLAKLHGARLVVAIETEKGRRWSEAKIKALTGGDKITARFMRQDFFDFTPKFKLLISGNHKPRLSSVDEAIKRRLLLVPFIVQIPLAQRDKDLADKLKAEWPAILRWMMDGCLEWQRIGLAPPKSVLDATDDYFGEQDTLQQWLDECTTDAGAFAITRLKELFASWKAWCEAANLKPGSDKALSEALRDKGFTKQLNRVGQSCFRNIVIRQDGGAEG